MARQLDANTSGLSEHAASTVAFGLRVDRYLAARSGQTSDERIQLGPELFEVLNAWTISPSNPSASASADLRKLGVEGKAGAQCLLQTFTRSGARIDGLAKKPSWTARYAGKPKTS